MLHVHPSGDNFFDQGPKDHVRPAAWVRRENNQVRTYK